MWLVPGFEFTVITHEPEAVVRERLLSHVFQDRAGNAYVAPRFRGDVSATGFRLTRIIGYRNGFVPAMRGHFESTPVGTCINVDVGLTTRSVVFLCVWSGLLLPLAVLALIRALSGDLAWLSVLPMFGLLLLGWLLMLGGFWSEALISKERLTKVLSGTVINSFVVGDGS